MPFDALRRVFEDDAASLEVVADLVGGREVTVLPGFGALGDEPFDFLFEGLFPGRRTLVEQSEDAGEFREQVRRVLDGLLRRAVDQDLRVHIADEFEDGGDAVGRIEVVVHGRDELLTMGVEFLREGLIQRAGLRVRESERHVIPAVVEPVEGTAALLDDVERVVDGHSVMGGDHQETNELVPVFLGHFTDHEEVALGLGHLLVVDVDEAVVHPVVRERLVIAALGLRDLVLVVREDEVLAAAVDVDGLAEVAAIHCGALDMPAGTAVAPGALPVGLAGLGCLPEREVHRLFLEFADVDAGAGLQFVEGLVGQFAVAAAGRRDEIDVSVLDGIGMALVDQGLDDVDDLIHDFRSTGMDVRAAHVQAVSVLPVLFDVLLRDGLVVRALFVGAVDDLVIDVREVLHERDLVTAVLEVAAEHVEHAERTGVADVDVVVNRGSAAVDLQFSGDLGNEFFFFAGQGVEYLHG